MKNSSIVESIKALQNNIEELLRSCQRKPDSIAVIAVSKTCSFERIEAAHAAGLKLFGESRVQEFMQKKTNIKAEVLKSIEVHLIGTLQRNKTPRALKHFSCIQSVDSLALLENIGKELHKQEHTTSYPVFLQIRSSDYDYKHGFNSLDSLCSAVELLLKLGNMRLRGIMTIGPFSSDEKIVRSAFAKTRNWAEQVQKKFALSTSLELSMGMSSDFEYAILEGSTMLRIGSRIFGQRT